MFATSSSHTSPQTELAQIPPQIPQQQPPRLCSEQMNKVLEILFSEPNPIKMYPAQQPFLTTKQSQENISDTYVISKPLVEFCEIFQNAFTSQITCFIPINLSQSHQDSRWVGLLMTYKKKSRDRCPDEIICLNPFGHDAPGDIVNLPSMEEIASKGFRSFISLSLVVGLIHLAFKDPLSPCKFIFRQQQHTQTLAPGDDGYYLLELFLREVQPHRKKGPISFGDYDSPLNKCILNVTQGRNSERSTPKVNVQNQASTSNTNTDLMLQPEQQLIHTDLQRIITARAYPATLQIWFCHKEERTRLLDNFSEALKENRSNEQQSIVPTLGLDKDFSFLEALAFKLVATKEEIAIKDRECLMELLCLPYSKRYQLIADMINRRHVEKSVGSWQKAYEETHFRLFVDSWIENLRWNQRSHLSVLLRDTKEDDVVNYNFQKMHKGSAGMCMEDKGSSLQVFSEIQKRATGKFKEEYGKAESLLNNFPEKSESRTYWEKLFLQRANALISKMLIPNDDRSLPKMRETFCKLLGETLDNQIILYAAQQASLLHSFNERRNLREAVNNIKNTEETLNCVAGHLELLQKQGFFTDIDPKQAEAEVLVGELNVSKQDSNGNTLLHFASAHCLKGLFELLLQAGANPFLANRGGKTPLELLTSAKPLQNSINYQSWMTCMRKLGQTLDITITNSASNSNTNTKQTLSKSNCLLITELDVVKRVVVSDTDEEGNTALHQALVHLPQVDFVEQLLACGCNLVALNRQGQTPSDYLIRQLDRRITPRRGIDTPPHLISPLVLSRVFERTRESGQTADQFNAPASPTSPFSRTLSESLIAKRPLYEEYRKSLEKALQLSRLTSSFSVQQLEIPPETRRLEDNVQRFQCLSLARAEFEMVSATLQAQGRDVLGFQQKFANDIHDILMQATRLQRLGFINTPSNPLFGFGLVADSGVIAAVRAGRAELMQEPRAATSSDLSQQTETQGQQHTETNQRALAAEARAETERKEKEAERKEKEAERKEKEAERKEKEAERKEKEAERKEKEAANKLLEEVMEYSQSGQTLPDSLLQKIASSTQKTSARAASSSHDAEGDRRAQQTAAQALPKQPAAAASASSSTGGTATNPNRLHQPAPQQQQQQQQIPKKPAAAHSTSFLKDLFEYGLTFFFDEKPAAAAPSASSSTGAGAAINPHSFHQPARQQQQRQQQKKPSKPSSRWPL